MSLFKNCLTELPRINSLRFKFCTLLIFISIDISLHAQTKGFCGTSPNIPNFLSTIPGSQLKSAASSYTIRIFFHIMRKSDGTGGLSQQEVNTAFNTLVSDYQSYNIYFSLLGTDEIRDDTNYDRTNFTDLNDNTDLNGDGKFDVFSVNSHTNAIDIYLFANDKLNFGLAANIPGTALVIGGNAFNTNLASSHVLSHEVGHCLGLFHTFHGTDRVHEAIGCAEFVDGSNGSTCGDFVQDTPADPSRIFDCGTQSTCTWDCSTSYTDVHGAHYTPDTHLFMAYTFPNCMNHHTSGQVTRMFSAIANSCLLQNVLVRTISGPTSTCDPSTVLTYTVTNLPSMATVNWTSNNVTYVSGQGSNSYSVKVYQQGDASIQATINSTCGNFTLPALTIQHPGPSVSINGPTFIATGKTATYTGYVNCGGSNIGYMWYLKDVTKGLPAIYLGTDYPLSLKAVAGSSSNVMIPNNPIGGGGHNYIITLTAGGTNGLASNTYAISCMAGASIVANTLLLMSPASNMSLSPNPASNNIQVNIIKPEEAVINSDTAAALSLQSNNSSITTYQVRIVNSFGVVFYSTKQTGDSFTIPVSNLPNGTYIVEAYDGKQSYRQQLIIKH